MTNEVKKVPELRFPEFDGEWEEKKLGEVVNYKNGGSFESLVKNRGVYKLITLKSVNTEGKLINSEKYIDDKCVETLCNGTLVMILSEQAPGLVGMTAIIPNNNEYVLNQRVAALVPKQFIDSQFLSKLINRNQKYFSVRSAGTKVKNISKGHVENFNFLSPDYTEQQKIGEFFSKLDRQIELEEQKLEKLEEQKKGYMQQIFSQELRFKDENGDEYPEWEDKRLLNVITIQNGYAFKSNLFLEKGMPIIRITDINKSIVKKGTVYYPESIEIKERFKIKQYDILIAMSGATTGKVGKYISEKPSLLNQRIGKFVMKKGTDNNFMFTYLNSLYFKKELSKLLVAGAQPNISSQDIENINLFIPTNEEQREIGDFFNELDELIEKQSHKIELLKERKQGFLQKMFV
ncbi:MULTISPECIES: restriction endonuclease subunit S [unclassified Mammaliicoccus]|uniref:restriction endonuclease subunit S n=1 Tax=unclassified Mammaliicoccus TaxID=2803851 RepID=UPI001EFC1D10|nr:MULTISPECIES: restriction endonuclease subunit S [unclassified Mammaliicoccus]